MKKHDYMPRELKQAKFKKEIIQIIPLINIDFSAIMQDMLKGKQQKAYGLHTFLELAFYFNKHFFINYFNNDT